MTFERFKPTGAAWGEAEPIAKPMAAETPPPSAMATVRAAIDQLEGIERPPSYSERAWFVFLADLRRFTDQWLDLALGCGWGLLDLYGGPLCLWHTRLDQTGVVLLLDGREVLSIDSGRIVIENGSAGPAIFYRQTPGVSAPHDRSRGRLIWETITDPSAWEGWQ